MVTLSALCSSPTNQYAFRISFVALVSLTWLSLGSIDGLNREAVGAPQAVAVADGESADAEAKDEPASDTTAEADQSTDSNVASEATENEPPASDDEAESEPASPTADDNDAATELATTDTEDDPYAESAGQADLDKATILKLSAKSMGDLETVVELCQKAIKAGLDGDTEKYAQELMASTLFEQASRLSRLVFDQQPPDRRWPRIRQLCLQRIRESLAIVPENGNALLLRARLNGLPGGDRDIASEAVKKAITLLEEPTDLSRAYQIRAGLTTDPDERLNDLNRAIELAPANQAAWRARGLHYLASGDTTKAMQDLEQLLEKNPDDLVAHQAIAQSLSQMEKYDEAKEHLDAVIEKNDRALLAYNLRAQVLERQGDIDGAVKDLNRALEIQPRDLGAILSRARLRFAQQQFDLARSDIERALKIRPGLPQAILMRGLLSAAQGRNSEAIGDLQRLLKQDPGNVQLRLQLATFYELDQRPRRAIKLYSSILDDAPESVDVLRRRADVLLGVGRHAEAIQDYETILAKAPDDSGALNNLAWVLSTSPDDEVRDGKRAIDVATLACEKTSYEAPHIISTLAASYAETGDFEQAIKWSEKAVAMESNQQAQLQEELDSYREGKPWREKQELEENPNALDDDGAELPEFNLTEDPEPALEPELTPNDDGSSTENEADGQATTPEAELPGTDDNVNDDGESPATESSEVDGSSS